MTSKCLIFLGAGEGTAQCSSRAATVEQDVFHTTLEDVGLNDEGTHAAALILLSAITVLGKKTVQDSAPAHLLLCEGVFELHVDPRVIICMLLLSFRANRSNTLDGSWHNEGHCCRVEVA
jgi:hypothetical protein